MFRGRKRSEHYLLLLILFLSFKLLQFLMHLRGEPMGLSVGGLVVINKSLALSVCLKHF